MEEEQEKDNMFLYIIIVVVLVAGVVFAIKSSESGKYETSKRLIEEDSSNSAYKK